MYVYLESERVKEFTYLITFVSFITLGSKVYKLYKREILNLRVDLCVIKIEDT